MTKGEDRLREGQPSRSRGSHSGNSIVRQSTKTKTAKCIFLLVFVSCLALLSSVDARRLPWTGTTPQTTSRTPFSLFPGSSKTPLSPLPLQIHELRGGELLEGRGSNDDGEDEDEDDEERYSRQVYTMGARAHGLIRSSAVFVDGPIRSGLLWESIKNLALSGVGKLVLIVDGDDGGCENNSKAYHVPKLDDLGEMYIRGALSELGEEPSLHDSPDRLVEILVGFLRRLNPALEVSTVSKQEILSGDQKGDTGGILLCVDRPYSKQEEWNEFCRSRASSSAASSSTMPWKFVSVETAGVYGRIFCDFGKNHEIHDMDGETPLIVPLDRVEVLSKKDNNDKGQATTTATKFLVKSVGGEHHDVSRDDIVVFQRSDGSTIEELSCKVTNVRTPEQIEVELIDSENDRCRSLEDQARIEEIFRTEAVTFSRQKQIVKVTFRSLKDAFQEAGEMFRGEGFSEIFAPCDLDKSFDETRRGAVFCSFQALDSFVQEHGRMPTSSDDDETLFCEMASATCANTGADTDGEWNKHCQNFLRTCPAKLVPLQAIFGAIASQECLKAVSGLYNPVRQFLLYDCDEVLASEASIGEYDEGCEIKHGAGLSFLLGSTTVARLQNKKLFVVGSGAIGCELLKNLAAMGAGTGNDGKVVVTDMDTIEKSNLSRQLLFRDSDIGKFKSKAAEEAVHRMNPSVKVESHTNKVGDDEDPSGPFDEEFWAKGVDAILNALDNMEARLFMDSVCVTNQKALIDAGTLGSKGNVQVVVPHQSESYGSSIDPPEPAIPVCTLKNFPYAISHTIQWGRDLFDGLFVRRPNQANQHAQELLSSGIEGLVAKLDEEMGDEAAVEAAKELAEDLLFLVRENGDSNTDVDSMKPKAIHWAINLGKSLFRDAIAVLLEEHPIDEVDDDGELFWSGSRKPPRPLSFALSSEAGAEKLEEEIHKNIIDFVRSAARLRYETYTGIPSASRQNLGLISNDTAREALIKAAEPAPTPVPKEESNNNSKPSTRAAIKEILAPLKEGIISNDDDSPSTSILELSAAEFEKDDESNDHITFITAASNLRAICYGIAPVDAMETRKVAGKIIPAMVTTTAFVSALSCLELIKLTQGLPLHRHKNAFINLALPFFAFTAPLPAEEYDGVRGQTHTLWDKINIKEGKKSAKSGGIKLKHFIKRIQKKAYPDDPDAVQVSNISIGPIMVYANFLHDDDKDLLNTSIWEVIENALRSGEEFDEEFSRDGPISSEETKDSSMISSVSFIDLTVSVEDTESFDEVELPQVRLFRSK